MFKNIEVFSRQNMVERSFDISEPCIIVSISDKGASAPALCENNPNILDVLHLFFDDEDSSERAMTENDAFALVDFLDQYADEDVDLFFHCNAGVSRSAACAAASMMIYWGDDSKIFQDMRYCPNMHCYRLLLAEANPSYDEIVAAQEEREKYEMSLLR